MRFFFKTFRLFLVLLVFASCKKEENYYYDAENPLSFSDDTVKFDTVFTTLGSTTRRVKIFNRSKDDITISKIELAGGSHSSYQININGIAANSLSNFKIRGRDSINLFVRVNIDPTVEETPFIVADSIHFFTDGKQQKLQLQAFGQNARFVRGVTITSNTVWDKTLPYVVYDSVKVAEGKVLTLLKGTRVYFHKGAGLIVAGTLNVQGEFKDSVTMASDRKERIYSEVPGQWEGIHFLKSSKDNVINNAMIKNALVGIKVDSVSVNANPKVVIANSIVKNMEVAGMLGYNTSIAGFNNLFANCGKYLIYCNNGGDYNFKQNTFVNFFSFSARITPSLFFSDYVSASSTSAFKLSLINNIIWGNQADELIVEKKGNDFTQLIRTNLIRSKDKNLASSGNIINSEPLFVDVSKYDFRLLSSSPAVNVGENLNSEPSFSNWLSKDRKGKERVFPSELGCYEIF